MKTIKGKILLVVISTLIVITAVVTYISFSITHEIMHTDADRILKNVSQKEAAYINEMLNDFIDSANIIDHYATNEFEARKYLNNEGYIEEYIGKVRVMFDEVARNASGTYSYYFCLSPKLTDVPMGFYTQFDKNGKIYELSEEQFSELSIITDEELIEYSNFIGGSKGEWVYPHPSRFTGVSVISYIMPVYVNNTFVGLLGFNMEFDYLLDKVNNITVYEYGDALLVDEATHTHYNEGKHEAQDEFDEEYTTVSAPLVNGMSLELCAAYKDIQKNIRPMLNSIITAFLVVFALAVIFTIWMTNKITGPLKKILIAAEDVKNGVKPTTLTAESDDEIGLLATTLHDAYEKIEEYSSYVNSLAYRDSLTGVKNTTAYREEVEALNEAIGDGKASFGVIVADINYLKQTNDNYGHDVGNDLIIHTARAIKDAFKESPVFRIGGDEFAIILKGDELANCRNIIDEVDNALAKDYINVNNDRIPVSVARGVYVFDSNVDKNFADVFEKADRAMYINKRDMKSER